MTAEEKARYAKALWRWGQDHQQEEKNVVYLEDRMYAVKLEGLGFVAIIKADSMFEAVEKVEQDVLRYR